MNEKDPDFAATPRARRRVLLAGVAAAAALAGAGLAWWRLRPGELESGVEQALWQRRFPRPEGGELVLQSMRGKPLLINFWATWCPPCVEELPMLDRFYREHAAQGWQIVGLAVDQLAAVQGFLRKLPLSFPVGLAGFEGAALARSLGNQTGGLPFTVVLDGRGRVLARKMGQLTPQDLQQWVTIS